MKAKYIFLLLMIFAKLSYSQEPDDLEQPSELKGMLKVAKAYFRSNPYQVHFSTFLNHLTHDPTLSHKTIRKRTDTSFFSLQGEYDSHNPYSFKASRVEIRLVEGTVSLEDSLSTSDTLLFYQLLGYSYGEKAVAAVKGEFERFERRYRHYFPQSEFSELKREDKVIGLVENYFTSLASFSPLAISWIKIDDYQCVFTVSFRMKVFDNFATLPMSLHDNQ
jgi:hypothetical protein